MDIARRTRRYVYIAVPAAGMAALLGALATMAVALGDLLPIPQYHRTPARQPLPRTLSPELFSEPEMRFVYTLAAKIPATLYQLPCYCYCDRSLKHSSLLDCFVGKHATECDICRQEVVYAYCKQMKGANIAEIRKGITTGAWERIDLTRMPAGVHSGADPQAIGCPN